jgi:hypothetical protein
MVNMTEFWSQLRARLNPPIFGTPRASSRRVSPPLPDGFFLGVWAARSELNVPGPFYGADTDTCMAGQPVAPANVAFTGTWQEFVWRQPRSNAEVDAVIEAARQDPFSGYGRDGSVHWTPDLVAAWWEGRHARRPLTEQAVTNLKQYAPERAEEYWEYATTGAENDLVRYAEWLAESLG